MKKSFSSLKAAYATPDGIYVAGDTAYIKGSMSAKDWYDDLKIPFGLTSLSTRYKDASRILDKNPQVQRVVGHSLGGAVALELQQRNPELKSVTYGAPVASFKGSSDRHRGWLDPVAFLDFGAQTSLPKQLNPHGYHALAEDKRHKFAPGTFRDGYRYMNTDQYYR